MSVRILSANLDAPEFAALIETHAELMLSLSPPGSCHFLPMDGLRDPAVTVWEMRDGDELVGCGGLKELSPMHGEIKSMHTLAAKRGAGLGRKMLDHVMREARQRGYAQLSLETGSMDGFKPSRTLYQSCGFEICPPFGDYVEDPHSVFMTLHLQ
ncbi:MAG: GNAT family N-acetyltransferase [Hyphomonadaceae bacterium]|nr:GNAT family N-acetyltransferase [Hyphomonadaceae bacterium]